MPLVLYRLAGGQVAFVTLAHDIPKIAGFHDRPRTQGLSAMAVLALERRLFDIPAVFRTSAMLADNAGLFPVFLLVNDTRRFLGAE